MTNKQLSNAWEKGKKWMIENEDPPKFDQVAYWKGLKRIEELEDEMRKRKVGLYK